MPTHPLIGKDLGNYTIKSLIGEGGMGAVFAGEHRFLGTRCAIKVLHGSYINNPQVTQRFFQEARATLEIDHPNIIKVLDLGQSNDGSLYLVMELLEGRSLGQAIAHESFGEGAVARIGSLIADGLAAAHAKGVVHRDLKPDNVFLTGDQVKVLDFGIAKVMQSSSSTKTGSLLGTPQYMAPEQAKGSKHVGPHTDVYALGAMLFEMLTRRPPFVGEDLPELLAKQLFEPPPSPRELVPCSPEMEAIILSCLEKDPAARPPSMIDLRDRLKTRIGVTPAARAPGAIAPTITPMAGQSLSSPIALAMRKTPPGDPAATAESTPATFAPTGPTTPRPYTPTYTPSTIASAASEVIAPPPRPARPSTMRNLTIGVAAALAVALGAGAIVLERPASPEQIAATTPPTVPPQGPEPVAPSHSQAATAPAAPRAPLAQKVVVRSEPPGAVVTVDGRPMGPTPALLTLSLPQQIFVSMKGYRTAREVLSSPGEVTIHLEAERRHTARPHPQPKAKAAPAAPATNGFKEGLD